MQRFVFGLVLVAALVMVSSTSMAGDPYHRGGSGYSRSSVHYGHPGYSYRSTTVQRYSNQGFHYHQPQVYRPSYGPSCNIGNYYRGYNSGYYGGQNSFYRGYNSGFGYSTGGLHFYYGF